MPVDPDEIVVGATGRVLVAPVGTAAPADVAAAFGVAWKETGYINENGARFTDAKSINGVPVWQSMYDARRQVASRNSQVGFGMRQWNKENVKLAFGGGTVTEVSAGQFKYAPPAAQARDERAMALEWEDGAKKYRIIIPRGEITETNEIALQRTNAADLGVSFAVLASEAGDPWYLLTNDPAFDPAA